ncbi:MAG: hypothetical protein KAT15_13735, partial [Bacteroidales bacterium]|nr:hypothetical protein [Bacteroidales bacterium]
MKKYILGLAMVSFLVLSCSNGSASSLDHNEQDSEVVKSTSNENQKSIGKTVHLTKQDFLEKVMNYEK